MKYLDGEVIRVRDRVKAWDGCTGIVVASMDTDEYSAEHPREQWSYLKVGVMIDTDQAGLIHYPEADSDLELIERAAQ
jgi:hypothetical protein